MPNWLDDLGEKITNNRAPIIYGIGALLNVLVISGVIDTELSAGLEAAIVALIDLAIIFGARSQSYGKKTVEKIRAQHYGH